jgi:threonine/homoserine/homoserine lactone efflux protein
MHDILTLVTFFAAFLVFAASPGSDNMTIVARTLTFGRRSGIAYGLGTTTGILIFLVLSGMGLSLIAAKAGWLMTMLRYMGATWLIWTGVRLWMVRPELPEIPSLTRRTDVLSAYLTGIALNLGNPKMPLFYLALLPNVVGTTIDSRMMLMLAAIILVVETIVIAGHVLLAERGRRYLRSPRVLKRVNRVAGVAMIGAGVAAIKS